MGGERVSSELILSRGWGGGDGVNRNEYYSPKGLMGVPAVLTYYGDPCRRKWD